MTATVDVTPGPALDAAASNNEVYLTFIVREQVFALPVRYVRDVLGHQAPTRIPGSPPEVAGVLNLRGRIVTAIDVRCRLGLDPLPDDSPRMSVVVDHLGELYSLTVDKIGEVMNIRSDKFEENPDALDTGWQDFCDGICRLDDVLLVVLDVAHLLDITCENIEGKPTPSPRRGNSRQPKATAAE